MSGGLKYVRSQNRKPSQAAAVDETWRISSSAIGIALPLGDAGTGLERKEI
jgi:hypothetical protein